MTPIFKIQVSKLLFIIASNICNQLKNDGTKGTRTTSPIATYIYIYIYLGELP